MLWSNEMQEKNLYCLRCGTSQEVVKVHGIDRPVCPSCGYVHYFDPKLATTMLLMSHMKVLMVRRNTEPGMGLWSFPGGYVDRGENVEQAAAREVREETGLEVEVTELIGLYSSENSPIVLAAYAGVILKGNPFIASDEISDVRFFDPCQLPPLAFERDRTLLQQFNVL